MNEIWKVVDRTILILQGLAFATIALTIGGQIVCRKVFNRPLDFPEEMSVFLLVAVVYFGAVVVERRGAHISVDFLRDRLPASGRRTIFLLSSLCSLAYVVALAIGEFQLLPATLQLKSSAAQIPIWWVHLAIALACLLWAAAILTIIARSLIRKEG